MSTKTTREKKYPFAWAATATLLIAAFSAYVLLDAFLIPKAYAPVKEEPGASAVESAGQTSSQAEEGTEKASMTDLSYDDGSIRISVEIVRKYDTTIYVADIRLADASTLRSALAGDVYGRNIAETTSRIAESHKAVFAVNGDYYGFRDDGVVLRNGVLYRDGSGASGEGLLVDRDGNFSIIGESEADASSLEGAWQAFSFGPVLVEDGKLAVTADSEVSRAMGSNPRTAIGQIGPLHYLVVVSDGRTSESKGLSLLELAQEFYDRGCRLAYNLDGGGSSTMYLNGRVVNNPTDGRSSGERKVSDIVCIGYGS